MPDFSEYVIYADESGDHSLVSIDRDYPVFVLAFCIFRKSDYTDIVVPRFQEFKFRYFGHDLVVLHNHEIRKAKGDFSMLYDREIRAAFMDDLTGLIADLPFTVVAAVIDKNKLTRRYADPTNPYEMAMVFCLERAYAFLKGQANHHLTTHIAVECRGAKEDKDLELAFRRTVDGGNKWGNLAFDIVFADKKANSTGMQLADLIAHPIGRCVIKPEQPNRSYDVIKTKFRRSPRGNIEGWGLKTFP